jgi:Mg2+/Co2+ transporter CorB
VRWKATANCRGCALLRTNADVARLNRTIDWLSKDLDESRTVLNGLIVAAVEFAQHPGSMRYAEKLTIALDAGRKVVKNEPSRI